MGGGRAQEHKLEGRHVTGKAIINCVSSVSQKSMGGGGGGGVMDAIVIPFQWMVLIPITLAKHAPLHNTHTACLHSLPTT